MKKTLLYFAAVTALFAACTKEIEETIKPVDEGESSQTEVHSYKLVASIPTKTTLTDDIFNWASGETIAVADETTTPKEFSISEDAEERAAGIFTYDGALTGSLRYAVTPADNVTVPSTSGNEVQIELPTNYAYVAGQTNAVMISTAQVLESGTYSAHFAHTMALIKVSYTNVPVGTKYFKLTMDKYISGVTLTKDASTVVTISTDDVDEASIGTKEKYVTVTLASAVSEANSSMTFYVPVPTGTYESFKVQLCDADDHILSEKNRDLAASGKSLTLTKADVFATPAITLPLQKVLTFSFTSEVSGWPQDSSSGAAGDYTYTIDKVDYTFSHTKSGNGIYQSSPAGKTPYLMMIQYNALGLPALTDYRLARVSLNNSSECSTSVEVGIVSNLSTKPYVDDDERTITLASRSSVYSFNLSNSYKDKVYYLYVANNKNAQIYSLALVYEVSSRAFTPTTLTMNTVSCSARTSTSLTFSWTGVSGAAGYQISKDDDSHFGSTQLGTSFTYDEINPFSEYTIYVKAIGDGADYLTSSALSATAKTKLTVPTSVSWDEGNMRASWTDANSSYGTYNTDYKYYYSLDGGSTSTLATTSTTANLSITETKTIKVRAVCLDNADLNSDWTSGTSCTIGGAVETTIYSTGFESGEGFTAGTKYNSTVTGGPSGKQWTAYYGTPSSTDAIVDSQSMQMRVYDGQSDAPYAMMAFDLSKVTKISFKAKSNNTTDIKGVRIYYSTNSGSSWSLAKTHSFSGTTTEDVSYTFASTQATVRFKLELDIKSGITTSRRCWIDSVEVKGFE